MLGLLLIYFIGKYFHDLAIKYNRNKWLAAIGGVVSYYAGTFIGGLLIGLFYELVIYESIDSLNSIVLNLMALPFGMLICYVTYTILKNHWKKNRNEFDTLDGELLEDDVREY